MNTGLLDATGQRQLFLLSMIIQMENELVNTQKSLLQSVGFLTTYYLSQDICLYGVWNQ